MDRRIGDMSQKLREVFAVYSPSSPASTQFQDLLSTPYQLKRKPDTEGQGQVVVNAEVETIMRDIFQSYNSSDSSVDRAAFKLLSVDCRICEGALKWDRLSSIFDDYAGQSRQLNFEQFLGAMSRVAEEKYGHMDALARLVFFKLLRFSKRHPGQEHRPPSAEPSLPELSPNASNSSATSISPSPVQSVEPSTPRALKADSPWRGRYDGHVPASPTSPVSAHLATPVKSPTDGIPLRDESKDEYTSPSAQRATMLAMHRMETADSKAMYMSAHLLMSAFDRYSDVHGTMGVDRLIAMLRDAGLIPEATSEAQVRKCFQASCVGDADAKTTYGGMLRCLRACARAAFGGDDADARMVRCLRRSLAHVLYDNSEDMTASKEKQLIETSYDAAHAQQGTQSPGRSHSPSSQTKEAPSQRGRLSEESCEEDDTQQSLQQLAESEQRAMEALLAQWTQKELTFRSQRDSAAAALERVVAQRLADNGRLLQSGSVLRSEQNTKSRVMHASGAVTMHALADTLLLRDGTRIANSDESSKIVAELDKARAALREETRALEQHMMADMHASFESLKKKFEARRRLILQGPLPAGPRVSACIQGTHDKEQEQSGRPSSSWSSSRSRIASRSLSSLDDLTARHAHSSSDQAASHTLQARAGSRTSLSNVGHGKPATADLHQQLRKIFSNVFEAFIFLDVHSDHTVHRSQLRRQLPFLHSRINLEQLMTEIDSETHDGRLDVLDFAKHFTWHALGSVEDQHARYLQALKLRRRIVERVHHTLFGGSAQQDAQQSASLVHKHNGMAPSSNTRVSRQGRKVSLSCSSDDMQLPIQWNMSRSEHTSARTPVVVAAAARPKSAPRERPSKVTGGTSSLGVLYERRPPPKAAPMTGDAARVAELERQNKLLADQLQHSERRLTETRSSSVGRASVAPSSVRSVGDKADRSGRNSTTPAAAPAAAAAAAAGSHAKVKPVPAPEFVGPQGTYKDDDGLSAIIRSDDTKTISQYVSRTGLWFAVPAKATTKPRPYRATTLSVNISVNRPYRATTLRGQQDAQDLVQGAPDHKLWHTSEAKRRSKAGSSSTSSNKALESTAFSKGLDIDDVDEGAWIKGKGKGSRREVQSMVHAQDMNVLQHTASWSHVGDKHTVAVHAAAGMAYDEETTAPPPNMSDHTHMWATHVAHPSMSNHTAYPSTGMSPRGFEEAVAPHVAREASGQHTLRSTPHSPIPPQTSRLSPRSPRSPREHHARAYDTAFSAGSQYDHPATSAARVSPPHVRNSTSRVAMSPLVLPSQGSQASQGDLLREFKSRAPHIDDQLNAILAFDEWDRRRADVAGPLDTSPHWDVSRETTPVDMPYDLRTSRHTSDAKLVWDEYHISEPFASPRTRLHMPEPHDAGESCVPYEFAHTHIPSPRPSIRDKNNAQLTTGYSIPAHTGRTSPRIATSDRLNSPRNVQDRLNSPRNVQDRLNSPRNGQDRLTSPRNGQDRLTSPRNGQDRLTSPRNVQDRLTSPRNVQDRLNSPRNVQDRLTSPRNVQDRLNSPGSSQSRDVRTHRPLQQVAQQPERQRRVATLSRSAPSDLTPDVSLTSTPVRADWLRKQLLGGDDSSDDD